MIPFFNRYLCYVIPLFTGIALLALCGCNNNTANMDQRTAPTLPYKVDGATDSGMMEMQGRLQKKGIEVVSLGQNYLVSIPSALIFADQSPRLRWGSYAILNDVACYLKQFRKIVVHVTAYSNKCISQKRDKALTLARAKAVGNYLWSQNIDTRFIVTQGLGSDKPIVTSSQGGDLSKNSRIEITFHDAVA